MNLQTAWFLIADDKEKEGRQIAETMWQAMLPVLFVPYDQSVLMENQTRFTGVRAIFMDINLHGDGTVGPKDFSAIQVAIDTLLHENNGPYVLVLWSSYTENSEQLFKYLRERLSEGKKPLWWEPLDKSPYISGRGRPSRKAGGASLQSAVTTLLERNTNLNRLIEWEKNIHRSASDVIHTVSEIAVTGNKQYSDQNLGGLLAELASAEAGKTLSKDNFIPMLNGVLSSLLRDRLQAGNFGSSMDVPSSIGCGSFLTTQNPRVLGRFCK